MRRLYLIIIATALLTSCATIPRASVEMSIQIEQQLYALKQANESVINVVFDAKEQNMTVYIDNTLFPEYLDGLFKNPSIQNVWDEMVANNNYEERLEVIVWLNKNIQKQYKETKDSLLLPIREERLRVLKSFNDEFNTTIQMNSTVTRNIASANTIQEAYEVLASKVIDTNRLDSIITSSLQNIDSKLNSIKKGIDVYEKNEDKINNIIKKIK